MLKRVALFVLPRLAATAVAAHGGSANNMASQEAVHV